MRLCALLLALTVAATPVFAQRGERDQKGSPGKNQGMSKDQRQQMREDLRNFNQDRNRQDRQQRQMSPQEREKLRRDIQDANRDLRK